MRVRTLVTLLSATVAAESNSTEIELDVFKQSHWQVRDVAQSIPLSNAGAAAKISSGDTHIYQVPPDLRGEMISLSICDGSNTTIPLNLVLVDDQLAANTSQGMAGLFLNATSNGTVAVQAPNRAGANPDTWSYELGVGSSVSLAAQDPGLFLVDTDFANALLVSLPFNDTASLLGDMYSAALLDSPANLNLSLYNSSTYNASQFSLYIYNGDTDIPLARSVCGVRSSALLNTNNADVSETTRGQTKQPRGQYLVKGLNTSSSYTAYITYPPPNGSFGGTVFPSLIFGTKASLSCQLVYNMTFCSGMAFAVPGNASAFSIGELTKFYDDMAASRYQNFTKSLQQIPCDEDPIYRYSVFSTCDDCASAYRDWLCAVSIPRCEDWTNNATYLVERKAGESRNPAINEYVLPGDYKEILPCENLCYDLARRCPAALGFACPSKKYIGSSYGVMSTDGDITCSFPNAVYDDNGALRLIPSWLAVAAAIFVTLICIY